MLERVIESKNSDLYDYDAGNINNYNSFENFVESSWIFLTNLFDFIVQGLLVLLYDEWITR